MKLKTDYKDAAWTGDRLYKITAAENGNSKIEDATEYTVEGDQFGAKDINETNERINRMSAEPIPVTLKASGWAGTAPPYVQTVATVGITTDDNPVLTSMLQDGATLETQNAYRKAFAIVAAGTGSTGDGEATFKVYRKPATDIIVGLKGV